MRSYNHVVLVGNLAQDPELRSLQNGTSVLTVGVAINESRKDQDGNWIEETSYFDVTIWGRTAEVVGEYAKKGTPVLVSGRLKQESWEHEGQRRTKVKVVADSVNILSFENGSDSDDRRNGSSNGNGYHNNGNSRPNRNGSGGGYSQRNGGGSGGYRNQNNNGNGSSYRRDERREEFFSDTTEDEPIPF